jgi:hypothetical protein
LFCLENKVEIRLCKFEWAVWIYCPFRAPPTIGGQITQGDARGLGYIGLSVRKIAMKNVCDKAEYPPDPPELCFVRLKAWHKPAQWHRLGLRIHPPDRRALKGQHTDRNIRCKYEWAAWIYCPFRAPPTIGGQITQGDAIGLGYIGLSVRNGAMKNVCDKAKYPPDTPELFVVRLKAWHIPAQWHRLGLRTHQPDRRALKGQHTDQKIRCKYEWAV